MPVARKNSSACWRSYREKLAESAVTASDRSGQIAPYANRGSFSDMMVNGDNVVGYNGLSYLVEGTSTSTAFASGMAAGLADSAHACADQAQGLLQKSLKPANILK